MTSTSTGDGIDPRWAIRIPIDPMTYRSLGYLLLAMPLGIAYLTILLVGFSLSVGLSVLLVGPVVLVLTMLMVVAMTWFDGVLTRALLGADVELVFPASESVTGFLKELFLSASTWLGLLFLLWKILLGIGAFVLIVVGLSVSVALLAAPLYYGEETFIRYGVGVFPIDSLSTAVIAMSLGLVVGYATLLVVNLLGWLSREVAHTLLVSSE